ncbi:hypothetical protein H8N03_22095 [Ramlibacter sp. USB13]|uniref:Uncharacterized protein n=1 Tax=Ramlibacter cellulosilyticus TaxID=2764187 RepID=A0A923SD84_9BURK|nr:hypothetical protein [Ramlibacter cellulosilyticus]MBC5785649.1 hypothetical protein [Ramlibacter cellulosilyticus]
MPQFGLVNGKVRHAMDAEIASAIQAARCRPAGEPRLFLGVLNEDGELYRYVTLAGLSQERHLRARLQQLGLSTESDPGVLRRLGTL